MTAKTAVRRGGPLAAPEPPGQFVLWQPPKRQRRERTPSVDTSSDLRTNRVWARAERIAAKGQYLPAGERALIEQVFAKGTPVQRLAELTGEPVKHLRRRIKRLVVRVTAPAFGAVVGHSAGWPSQMAVIGAAVFIRGLSIRAASAETGIPYQAARLHAQKIRAFAVGLEVRRAHRGEAA